MIQERLIIKIKHLEGRFPEILKKLIEEEKFNTNDQNLFNSIKDKSFPLHASMLF